MRNPAVQALQKHLWGDNPHTATSEQRCVNQPIGCGKLLNETSPFKDEVEAREYQLSGMCADCQRSFFNRPAAPDEVCSICEADASKQINGKLLCKTCESALIRRGEL